MSKEKVPPADRVDTQATDTTETRLTFNEVIRRTTLLSDFTPSKTRSPTENVAYPKVSVSHPSWPEPSKPAFEVNEPIGTGGMGAVYSASQVFMEREVAIKRSHDEENKGPSFKSVIDEGTRLGQLDHPNIPPVHLVGRDDTEHAVLVMKRIAGTNLREMLHDPNSPRWEDVQGDRPNGVHLPAVWAHSSTCRKRYLTRASLRRGRSAVGYVNVFGGYTFPCVCQSTFSP